MSSRTTLSWFGATLVATLILMSEPGLSGVGIVRADCAPLTVERMTITAHRTASSGTARFRMRAALRLPFVLAGDAPLFVSIDPAVPPPPDSVPGPRSILFPGGRCWRLARDFRADGLRSASLCPDRRDPGVFNLSTRLTAAGDLPASYPWTVRLDGESDCAATECAYTGLPCVSP